MARGRRRKCKCCLKLFLPDPCNRRHQRYCSAPRANEPARLSDVPKNVEYRSRWQKVRDVGASKSDF